MKAELLAVAATVAAGVIVAVGAVAVALDDGVFSWMDFAGAWLVTWAVILVAGMIAAMIVAELRERR